VTAAGAVKSALQSAAGRAGYEINRLDSASTMDAALRRLSSSHPDISTLVDVGASDGRWSVNARRHFPGAAFLLFEALESQHGSALRALAKDPAYRVVLAAAGDRAGTIHFNAEDAFGGAASTAATGAGDIVVPMTTIDAEVERRGLRAPYLIKLDTHGFEVPILAGAEATLTNTSAIVIEAYNFPIHPDALMFPDMCRHLMERGFRVVDLVDVMRRPRDSALWQFDLVFTRADRPEFQLNTYA
jgi:FkbM family methyltransferase